MRNEDLTAILAVMQRMKRPKSVHIVAGSSQEVELIRGAWGVEPTATSESEWDLNAPPPPHVSADLIVLCNVMMYSEDPALWLKNASLAAPLVLVQDCVRAKRGGNTELGHGDVDGDSMRYSVSHFGITAVTDPGAPTFDFSTCGYDVVDHELYRSSPPDNSDWTKVVVLLKVPS